MNAISKFERIFKGKKVALVGVGISNRPLVKMLLSHGALVTARDKNKIEDEELKNSGAVIISGENYLDNLNEEIIIKTPSIRFDTPEIYNAFLNKSIVTSEMELFYALCPTKNVIGITGSDGKTTTSTIIALMLQEAGKKVWLGGNIGKPLLPEIENIKEEDFVVTELSSFQLQTMKKSPKIAVVTNISPNHLDVHKSFEEYINAKKNIYLYQNNTDRLIINNGNNITNGFRIDAKADVFDFSVKNRTNKGIYLKDNYIYYCNRGRTKKVLNINNITVPGKHNIENFMAAILAVSKYVSLQNIWDVAKEFKGVLHRTSFIRELDKVKYYNSSIDSSPSRTIATLSVFSKNVILICGGKDKNLSFDELAKPILNTVKVLILTGQTSNQIYRALLTECEKSSIKNPVKVMYAEDYEAIVKLAKKEAKEGDTVLLSPASTSFDKFKNFEERGEVFTRLVMELKSSLKDCF